MVPLNVAQDNNPHSSFRYEEREAEEVIKKLDKLEVSKDRQEKCEKEEAEENTKKEEKDLKEPEINGTQGRPRNVFLDVLLPVSAQSNTTNFHSLRFEKS